MPSDRSTGDIDRCDNCGESVGVGNLYSLLIDLPEMRDAGLGVFCSECAETLADGDFTLELGGSS